MPRFMKSINIISRCQAAYRAAKIADTPAAQLSPYQHSIVLAICRNPGCSQEEIARDICLDKSTVTRTLAHLEDAGFVRREANMKDKRRMLVFPTEKMLAALPSVRSISLEWNTLISCGISEEELSTFYSVLRRMEEGARAAVEEVEGGKQ